MGKKKIGERGISARPMHFIWIIDCSGSMNVDGKIQALNNAIKESIPAMKQVAEENPFAEILVRSLKFSSGAQWHITDPVAVSEFKWTDLDADGVTDMGAALQKLAGELTVERLGDRGFPPVLVLISDGQPTDDYKAGIKALMATPWGKRACRVAVGIGQDADHGPLKEFMGPLAHEFPVLQANNPEQLAEQIRFISATVSKTNSSPASKQAGESSSPEVNVQLPENPPEFSDEGADADVW